MNVVIATVPGVNRVLWDLSDKPVSMIVRGEERDERRDGEDPSV